MTARGTVHPKDLSDSILRLTIQLSPQRAAASGGGAAEALRGPCPGTGRLRLPIARRCGGDEVVEQVA